MTWSSSSHFTIKAFARIISSHSLLCFTRNHFRRCSFVSRLEMFPFGVAHLSGRRPKSVFQRREKNGFKRETGDGAEKRGTAKMKCQKTNEQTKKNRPPLPSTRISVFSDCPSIYHSIYRVFQVSCPDYKSKYLSPQNSLR